MPTNLEQEREEQRRWIPRPSGPAPAETDELLANEFLPPAAQRAAESRRLQELVRLADAGVPYWRDLFGQLRLRPEEVADRESLPRLPVLTKAEVHRAGASLLAAGWPGERTRVMQTSGHSGPRTRYWRADTAARLQSLLVQRQLRWFRHDPHGLLAWISTPEDMCQRGGAPLLSPGETLRYRSWPGTGNLFHTGAFVGLSCHTEPEEKIRWLETHRPAYLRATSSELEELACLFHDRPRLPGLRGLRAIAEPLMPGMRKRIEETFGVPVHLGYGTDEIGWLATYCPEGDRYHTHPETALVEIVDAAGQPCPPGQWGRLLVTTVGNPAMPLLRLDTGDAACPIGGPCPCGRTLPSLGPALDRARHRLGAPIEIQRHISALREGLEALRGPFRKYQIARLPGDEYELRLVPTGGSLSPELGGHARKLWSAPATHPLRIVAVPHLPRSANGKFYHFVDETASPPP